MACGSPAPSGKLRASRSAGPFLGTGFESGASTEGASAGCTISSVAGMPAAALATVSLPASTKQADMQRVQGKEPTGRIGDFQVAICILYNNQGTDTRYHMALLRAKQLQVSKFLQQYIPPQPKRKPGYSAINSQPSMTAHIHLKPEPSSHTATATASKLS